VTTIDHSPAAAGGTSPETGPPPDAYDERMWTARLRGRATRLLPPDQLLPDRQPAYVASWIYVFGVLTLAALVVVLATGGILALAGPQWYHVSSVGHFVNSLHLWSVELFFFCMVIHLWGKFFMAAWRGRRAMTWVTGAVAFLGSIGTAFTGYLVQSNFDSQWISTQAKDGLNSVGVGAWFNVLDYGQMLLFHVVLLPLVIGVLTIWHVLLVRRRGVVPPFEDDDEATRPATAEAPRPGVGGTAGDSRTEVAS
jgi:quinol-cytochrome oxidoreductase complex cytochrome b subunit